MQHFYIVYPNFAFYLKWGYKHEKIYTFYSNSRDRRLKP